MSSLEPLCSQMECLIERLKESAATGDETLKEHVRFALRYAWSNGISFIANPPSLDSIRLLPFSLFPTLMSKALFDEARNVSVLYTQLIHTLSLNSVWHHFMKSCFDRSSTPFITDLMNVALLCYGDKEGQRNLLQDIHFNIMRSDYLLRETDQGTSLGLVEINTISSSYGAVSSRLEDYYRATLNKICKMKQMRSHVDILPNKCLDNIVRAFEIVHHLYIARSSCSPGHPTFYFPMVMQTFFMNNSSVQFSPAILFMVMENEENQLDQFLIEKELMNLGIPVIRKSFKDISEMIGKFSNDGHPLLCRVKNDSQVLQPIADLHSASFPGRLVLHASGTYWEITIVYFRMGYTPDHYAADHETFWKIREILEFSDAVKCPNIFCQLSGMKKMQGEWLTKLPLWHPTGQDVEELLNHVTVDHVNLCDYHTHPLTRQLVDKALQNPGAFVLKPQQEGGSAMIQGEEILPLLEICKDLSHPSYSNVSSYSLMRFIESPTHTTVCFSPDEQWCIKEKTVSELGIFTTVIHEEGRINEASFAGYLLRTKEHNNPRGGVSVGAAMLNYPLLYS